MKKLIIFLISFLFIGCSDDNIYSDSVYNDDNIYRIITINNHRFIDIKNKRFYRIGFVHDPECEKNDIKNLIDSINNSNNKMINLKVNI